MNVCASGCLHASAPTSRPSHTTTFSEPTSRAGFAPRSIAPPRRSSAMSNVSEEQRTLTTSHEGDRVVQGCTTRLHDSYARVVQLRLPPVAATPKFPCKHAQRQPAAHLSCLRGKQQLLCDSPRAVGIRRPWHARCIGQRSKVTKRNIHFEEDDCGWLDGIGIRCCTGLYG